MDLSTKIYLKERKPSDLSEFLRRNIFERVPPVQGSICAKGFA